jgi:GntR family transcriptional regulator
VPKPVRSGIRVSPRFRHKSPFFKILPIDTPDGAVILLYHHTWYRSFELPKAVPLLISVSPGNPRSIARQICDGIRMAIASGQVPVGAQLPSVRGLAQQLAINPKTVARAYGDLTSEGLLDARPGMGLYVAAPRQRLADAERERRLGLAIDAFSVEVVGLGYPLEHVLDRVNAALAPCLNKRSA